MDLYAENLQKGCTHMGMSIRCGCGNQRVLQPEDFGKNLPCPKCGATMSIPGDAGGSFGVSGSHDIRSRVPRRALACGSAAIALLLLAILLIGTLAKSKSDSVMDSTAAVDETDGKANADGSTMEAARAARAEDGDAQPGAGGDNREVVGASVSGATTSLGAEKTAAATTQNGLDDTTAALDRSSPASPPPTDAPVSEEQQPALATDEKAEISYAMDYNGVFVRGVSTFIFTVAIQQIDDGKGKALVQLENIRRHWTAISNAGSSGVRETDIGSMPFTDPRGFKEYSAPSAWGKSVKIGDTAWIRLADLKNRRVEGGAADETGKAEQEVRSKSQEREQADEHGDEDLKAKRSPESPAPLLERPLKLQSALTGREEHMKEVLLREYGGNPDSETAVALGLAWLAKNQQKDGGWSLTGPYRSGAVTRDIPESATAMALLAFQGAGNTPEKGEYKKQVAAGIKALLKKQSSDGNFYQQGAGNNWFYVQGQCTIALCELYGMTKDPALRRPAELAVKFCIESQDPELGGWKYLPRSASDTSVTGWIMMALQSARMAGLEVPSPVLQRVSDYLDKASPDGSRYGYEVTSEPTLAMTAEGLLCRQYLGWRRDDPRLVQGVELLMQSLPRYEDRDVYYWYYGTQVMHHMEGKYWSAWNAALRDMLVKHQEKTGPEKGSWDPLGEHPDRWSNLGQGMRLYTTCLSLYMLEVYYRHLPIYGVKK
jgi:hypothetical protein